MNNLTILLLCFLTFTNIHSVEKRKCVKTGMKAPYTLDKISITKETEDQVKKLIGEGKKLQAIKTLRDECSDMSLKEQKDLVESIIIK
jgi:ribosomal protein L7/L12